MRVRYFILALCAVFAVTTQPTMSRGDSLGNVTSPEGIVAPREDRGDLPAIRPRRDTFISPVPAIPRDSPALDPPMIVEPVPFEFCPRKHPAKAAVRQPEHSASWVSSSTAAIAAAC
jgi:hypothetical protein